MNVAPLPLKSASTALLGLALLAFAAGAVATLIDSRDEGPGLVAEPAVQWFGTVDGRSDFGVEVMLRNRLDRPIRVLGGSGKVCTLHGCLEAGELFPFVTPARSSRAFRLGVHCAKMKPGRFDASITLYTDAGGLVELPLAVRGEIVRDDRGISRGDAASVADVPPIVTVVR